INKDNVIWLLDKKGFSCSSLDSLENKKRSLHLYIERSNQIRKMASDRLGLAIDFGSGLIIDVAGLVYVNGINIWIIVYEIMPTQFQDMGKLMKSLFIFPIFITFFKKIDIDL
ncbi:hypothetical protein ACJX0J_027963, partial [Zea mays]